MGEERLSLVWGTCWGPQCQLVRGALSRRVKHGYRELSRPWAWECGASQQQEPYSEADRLPTLQESDAWDRGQEDAEDYWVLISRGTIERRRGSVWECLNHPWIFLRGAGDTRLRQENQINMDNLRNYQARKRWKYSTKVVLLSSHLSRAKSRANWEPPTPWSSWQGSTDQAPVSGWQLKLVTRSE